jgi:hypothetical protein
VEKSLDVKLARIKADPSCRDFILADAKDADMAFGIAAPGKSPEMHAQADRFRSLAEYRDCIRQVIRQGVVDIVLMSAHTSSILTIEEGLFDGSPVTPAARANDTTDIHVVRGGAYAREPSQPFRTATIDQIRCGAAEGADERRARGAHLGLYSVTFNNDPELDRQTLESYKQFRIEAEHKGFRHFLEVFDPNALRNPVDPDQVGGFINDMIARSLAGVPEAGRPLFLKMVYHGPRFTEELTHYDPSLVIGVLGGSSGTTYDAFKLIADAQKYGARAALFGRKINNAEHPLAFIEMLRHIVDGDVTAEEAVRAYRGVLKSLNIQPYRALQDDLQLTDQAVSYGGGRTISVPSGGRESAGQRNTDRSPSAASSRDARPDFSSMTSAQRLVYYRKRLSGSRTVST